MKPARGFASLVIVAIVAIALGIGGTLAYQKYHKKAPSPQSEITSTTQESIQASPSPAIDETTNWKTFRSQSGKFTLKYPNTWLELHMGNTAAYAEHASFGPNISSLTEDRNMRFWVQVQKNSGPNGTPVYPSAKEYIEASFKNAKDSPVFLSNKIDDVEVSGISGLKLTNSYTNDIINILIAVDKNSFTYVFSGGEPNEINQILSTFRFLD